MSTTIVKAGSKEWLGLAVLALPTLLLSLDVSVLYLALPKISLELHATSTQQLWILDMYGFLLSGFLVTMGTLGDRIGRRKLLLIGAVVFGIASVVAALSQSASMLIATRALLGVAGATLMPSTLGLIRNMFHDPKQMARAISVWLSCFMAGTILGPLVGGLLLDHFWWGSAFLLGVPVMVLLLVLGPLTLPEHRDKHPGRIDFTSSLMSLATILPIIYGLKELARNGWQVMPVAMMLLGLVFGVAFVRRQRMLTHPLLDIALFKNRTFSTALGTGLVGGVVMGGVFLFISLYLQMVAGLSPLQAGLWLIPQAIAMIAGSMIAPTLARRIRPAYIMAGGFAVSAVGFGLLTQVASVHGLATLVAGFVILAIGLSLPMALGTGLVMSSTPPEKAGAAGAMNETSGEFGIALGIATLGSLGTFVYRTHMDDLPQGLPAGIAQSAHESITGAVTGAAVLPHDIASALLVAARQAFTSGLHVVAAVGALLFISFALVIIKHLRKVPAFGEQQMDQG